MQHEIIIAGFGGQGVMLIGKILAMAALKEGKEVAWIPSYGPEMRGGTANCTVVIDDFPIGSPIIYSPKASVVMNKPSLDKFGPLVKPGGLLIINSSLIDTTSDRTDIDIVRVPANQIAIEEGNGKAANFVVLGTYIAKSKIVEYNTVTSVIEETFEGQKKSIAEIDLKALKRGYDFVL